MTNHFFEHPILNSPYEPPNRYWELDGQGQPTQQIIERRRPAEFITPIPKPRKRKKEQVEQRHLLYVACTRARDYLFITCAGTPSEFLQDLGMVE